MSDFGGNIPEYSEDYLEYKRYLSMVDYDVLKEWQPAIWGAMLKQPLKDFFCRFDWNKDSVLVSPICGEMPEEIQLVCYHAKRLEPEVIELELPENAMKKFHDWKRSSLYGSDPLSVIEAFEGWL